MPGPEIINRLNDGRDIEHTTVEVDTVNAIRDVHSNTAHNLENLLKQIEERIKKLQADHAEASTTAARRTEIDRIVRSLQAFKETIEEKRRTSGVSASDVGGIFTRTHNNLDYLTKKVTDTKIGRTVAGAGLLMLATMPVRWMLKKFSGEKDENAPPRMEPAKGPDGQTLVDRDGRPVMIPVAEEAKPKSSFSWLKPVLLTVGGGLMINSIAWGMRKFDSTTPTTT